MNETNTNNSKRNSCFILTIVGIIAIVIGVIFISKKVSNSFTIVDDAIANSNKSIHKSNVALKNVLLQNESLRPLILDLEKTSTNFENLLDSTINILIIKGGGWKNNINQGELVNPKNKDIPTKILVTNGLGRKIELAILETGTKYKNILSKKLNIKSYDIPLKLDKFHIKESGKTWSEFNFNQMPLMAVLPILRKFKQDEIESKAIIYRHLAEINKPIY